MGQIKLIVQNKQPTAENVARLKPYCGDKSVMCNNITKLMGEVMEGQNGQSVAVYVDGGNGAVQASGTATLASAVAGDSITVGIVTVTGVASGATGPQFNIGGTDTITAANIAAALNAQTGLTNVITATSSGAVVTIHSAQWGNIGNQIALTGSTHITASGAHLTGGTEPSNAAISCSGIL